MIEGLSARERGKKDISVIPCLGKGKSPALVK